MAARVVTLADASSIADLSALTGSPARVAAGTRLLRDGEAAFPAMLERIEAARRRVRFENFIFAGDATGRRFAAALAATARRGVDVRVLYDPIGTVMVRGGSIARALQGSGVDVRPFRPLSPYAPWTWTRLRHRDHRKTLCVDGEVTVVGGLCISDNWSPSSRGGGGWRDTALLVEGAVAADVERAFEAMWSGRRAPPVAGDPATGYPAVMVGADRPGSRCVARVYAWLADHAVRSLDLTDAYLVLPRRVLERFASAARRGVRVRLLLPGRNNHPLAGAAARHGYDLLLESGAEIWEWGGMMVHAKTVVVDEEISLVGSSNLDPLSLSRNYELNLLVVDPVVGGEMRAMFEKDLLGSRQLSLEEWRGRPIWRRTAESVARLLAPDL